MKNILLACGSGIATSTAVHQKLNKILDENGYKGKYKINQIKVSEAVGKQDNYDFLISTTMAPQGLKIPYISGVSFLTGVGKDKTIQEILKLMGE
ncbi:MAG: PTS sugar transporter subunit IIB [Enterococcaceae bacterium]|jgi:PTS system galactitol-specific IIB component|nr:PTS sugar transporter subunit IIB [Enterococcaceae bacterium]MCI1919305.1 PTS sugar transporter subunit IIB [Enterococcaceae bacterium]